VATFSPFASLGLEYTCLSAHYPSCPGARTPWAASQLPFLPGRGAFVSPQLDTGAGLWHVFDTFATSFSSFWPGGTSGRLTSWLGQPGEEQQQTDSGRGSNKAGQCTS
jgi:hypothetical protein